MKSFTNPTDLPIRVTTGMHCTEFAAGETKAVKEPLVQACLEARLVEVKEETKPAAKTTKTATKGS